MFHKRWLAAIYAVAYVVARQKEKLLTLDIHKSILVLLYLIVLEVLLAILSLPLYITSDYKKEPELFNRRGISYAVYRTRRRVTLSATLITIVAVISYVAIVLLGLFSPTNTSAASVTWDGGGVDNNWSTQENWSTDTVPTSADDIIFDGTTTTDSIIDAGFAGTVLSITIDSGYTGTITQNRAITTTVNFTMADGTFTGGASIIDIGGDFLLSGGVFTASSNTSSFKDDFTISGGTFNPNGGTLSFDGPGSAMDAAVVTLSADLTIDNLAINKTAAGASWSHHATGNTFSFFVTGTLYLQDGHVHGFGGLSQGTIIQVENAMSVDTAFSGGGAFIFVTGTPRTITFTEGIVLPRIDLFGGSTINLSGTDTTTINTLAIQDGTVNANNANLATTYSLSARSSSAVYNGGPGNEYIPGGILSYNSGSISSGGGSVVAGGSVYAYSSGTLDFSDASTVDINNIPSYGAAVFRAASGSTVTAPSTTLTFEGTYFEYESDATFSHNDGTFTFDGGGQDIRGTGAPIFYNLTITTSSADTFIFPAGVTTTVANAFISEGASGELLLLRSTTTGTQAILNLSATSTLSYLRLKDICNRGTTASVSNTEDEGNNCGFTALQDTSFPTTPGALTTSATTTSGVTLTYGATSTDTNFSDYRIAYAIGSTVLTTDSLLTSSTDANLASSTFAGATTTSLSGLVTSTQYSVMIVAYDSYGNGATSTATSFYTLATPPASVVASGVSASGMTVSWSANGNGSTSTKYYAEEINNTTINSGWATSTSYVITGLQANTNYTFRVKARNGEETETTFTPMTSSQITSAASANTTRGGNSGRPHNTQTPDEDETDEGADEIEETPIEMEEEIEGEGEGEGEGEAMTENIPPQESNESELPSYKKKKEQQQAPPQQQPPASLSRLPTEQPSAQPTIDPDEDEDEVEVEIENNIEALVDEVDSNKTQETMSEYTEELPAQIHAIVKRIREENASRTQRLLRTIISRFLNYLLE